MYYEVSYITETYCEVTDTTAKGNYISENPI